LQRWAAKSTSKFIANSSASVGFLNTLGVEDNRICLIHNGVSLSPSAEGPAEWRRKLGLRESDLVACMVANLHQNKDHETLLRAWRIVVDEVRIQGLCPVLLLAGRFDNMYEKLRTLASDLELDGNVMFLGSVKEIGGLLKAVDLGVFSSRNEGCPNGVLECMASGLAVAATDIPGTREALGTDSQSTLSPPGHHPALAANIVRLLYDAGLRQQEGERNRRRVAQIFTTERMCAETTEVIAELLSNN
jgi:glycosyltransferase involved in cell wall biosynthesis